jgi:uncharacterized protein YegJ (DUF2314 family)
MWYVLGVAAVLLGGAVMFDVVDFMPWGFVAAGLFYGCVKLQPKFPPRAYK